MRISYFAAYPGTGGGVAQITVEQGEVSEMTCHHMKDVPTLEKEKPEVYSKLQSDIDSGLALMVGDDFVTVCCYTDDGYTNGCLYNVQKSAWDKFKADYNANCRLIPNTCIEVCSVDGNADIFYDTVNGKKVAKKITEIKPNGSSNIMPSSNDIIANAISAVSGSDGAAISAQLEREREETLRQQEEAYVQRQRENVQAANGSASIPVDMLRGGMVDGEFMCTEESPVIITAMAFKQRFYIQPKSQISHFKVFMDKRYPSKYVPAIYEGKPGYAILIPKGTARTLYGGAIIPAEVDVDYQFYELNKELFDYKPDALPETIFHESALKKYLKFTDRIKVNVDGLSNLLADTVINNGEESEEAKAKNAQLIQFFSRFLLNIDYFKITSISGETGWVTAYTPRGNQVLLMACIKHGDVRDGLLSFIPIKGTVGIAVAGLTVDDYNDLASLVVRYAV